MWYLADLDLLDTSTHPYTLTDTGQGHQRVQPSPRLAKAMRAIVGRVQGKDWVGSGVVHLGDRVVANGLVFIDKYTQISRILTPILITLRYVETQYETSRSFCAYVNDTYGSATRLRKMILRDFFKSAFDGSGADNFYDAVRKTKKKKV